MLTILKPADIVRQWPLIQPILQGWVEREASHEFTTEDLLREAWEGKRDFWIVFTIPFEIKAVLSTYIFQAPRKKVWFCHIVALPAGSDLTGWFTEVDPVFRREAAYNGCDAIQMMASRGFARLLEKYIPGMRQLSAVCELSLDKEKYGRKQTDIQYQPNAIDQRGTIN